MKGVDKTTAPGVAFRSVQGSIANTINYACAKYLPITIIGLINNMSPVITVVLAYIFLKERLKPVEIVFFVLSVAGIVIIILGGSASDGVGYLTISQAPWLYVALFCNPFLTASGTIALRKIKKIHEYIAAWYLNITMMLSCLILVLCLD